MFSGPVTEANSVKLETLIRHMIRGFVSPKPRACSEYEYIREERDNSERILLSVSQGNSRIRESAL